MKPPARIEPKLPAKWSYRVSVRRMKSVVWKWKSLTAEMLHELWTAHAVLSQQGARSDLVAYETRSFTEYCEEIGLSRVTAWRWLKQYDPVERKLIEHEEDAARPLRLPARRDPDARLLAEIEPQLRKMTMPHRLRIAWRILRG